MLKLLCLANAVVLDNVLSFKSSNAAITNCIFEFDSIVVVQLPLSWTAIFESFICHVFFLPISFLTILELLQIQ